ncbi:MAG: PEGA domain-containing protein [Paramuribaculum sp.]|nr:PEGA domain-containing protein [Paramuribaculum sp.]
MDEADQTANVNPTMRTDINGEKCALIKIATTQKNFSFDVGSLGITHTEWQNSEHPGEIWLYVPNGVMKISIQHPQFGSIKDYDLGGRLKKGRTYVMELTSDQVNTLVVDYDNSQVLDVQVIPSNADFYINGIKQNLDSRGRTSITLPFGTHNYRATAKSFHPEESQIIINDKDKKQNLSIRLKQSFGYLKVNATHESKGGELYIDDVRVGTLPIIMFPLESGMHNLSVYQKFYFPYTEKIAMTDSATVTITPILKPNYAEYEILVDGDKDAKIYADGELIGTGHWKGKLEAGDHIIEARKISHTGTTQKINVVKGVPRKISLPKPKPIYGTLEIKTQPSNAEVFIDGNSKPAGVTNFINNHILIGTHRIKIVLPGHKTEEFDVEIKEGQTERINKVLTDFCDAMIYSIPHANISIDGKAEGKTPLRINRVAGNYQVTLSAHGYSTVSKKIRLDGNTKDITIKLHRNYTLPNELYMQVGANMGGMMSMNLGLGAFIQNVNIEGNYLLGLINSDKIYWSDKFGESVPFSAKYKPSGGNIKVGYGFRLHSRIRVTPQVGCQFISLKETMDGFISDDYTQWSQYYSGVADGSKAGSLSFGLRCNVALTPLLGLSVSPEYLVGISKSNGFKALSDVSSKIKGYTDGFNCNISLYLFLGI